LESISQLLIGFATRKLHGEFFYEEAPMNDQNGPGKRPLRDILHLSPDGCLIHHWSGLDRKKDTDELTRAIAAAIPGLCNREGAIARLDEEGKLAGVNFATFRELVGRHVCKACLINHGARWEWEYVPFAFAPARRFDPSLSGPQPPADESEPDAAVLEEIFRTELVKRLPRVR
jgi:hypothetical protein